MSDGEESRSWWRSLPGVITSLTAAITALAGLIVAINQTGWFAPSTSPPMPLSATTTTTGPPTTPPNATPPAQTAALGANAPAVSSPGSAASQAPGASAARSAYAVALPALRDYRLGEATFTLLNAEILPRTTEKDALRIRVRMVNHGRFDANFWDRSFRLTVSGLPIAPVSDLNELVEAESAKEGEVLFVVPHGTTDGTLEISHADDSTDIPLALAPPG